jgi:hypothetical protein
VRFLSVFSKLLLVLAVLEAPAFAGLAADGIPSEFVTDAKVVMAGDIHGNLDGLVKILQESGLVDADGHWIGGRSIFVSPGDILDGNKESALLITYLIGLKREAEAAGGQVITTYGNHEIMVSEGDILHVTKEEGRYYEDADPEEHTDNSVHYFFTPESDAGKLMRTNNQIVKISQVWKDAKGKQNTRSFIAVHAGLSKRALKTPNSFYNEKSRAWVKYWQYKERTKQLLQAQLDSKTTVKKDRQLLKEKLKLLAKDKLPIADENGHLVKRPPANTDWVVGYDAKTQKFNETDPDSPSWARFNRIDLDKKTGALTSAADPNAMTPEEFSGYLKQQGADFMVVGHEPTPKNTKTKLEREIHLNPRYNGTNPDTADELSGKLLNMDTRIGWVGAPGVGGELSFTTMENGVVKFHNEVKPFATISKVTQRIANGVLYGTSDCARLYRSLK